MAAAREDPREVYRLALEDFDAALHRDPDDVNAPRNRGETCLAFGRAEDRAGGDSRPWFDQALAIGEDLVRRMPNDGEARRIFADAHSNLGLLDQQQKQDGRAHWEAAIAAYRQGAERGTPECWFNLGVLLYVVGRPEEAIAAFESCARADPRLAGSCRAQIAEVRKSQKK